MANDYPAWLRFQLLDLPNAKKLKFRPGRNKITSFNAYQHLWERPFKPNGEGCASTNVENDFLRWIASAWGYKKRIVGTEKAMKEAALKHVKVIDWGWRTKPPEHPLEQPPNTASTPTPSESTMKIFVPKGINVEIHRI